MEAYKFETTIQENGVIQIPEMARLTHQRVEAFVVVSAAINRENREPQGVESFLDKWRGFLKGAN